jgi:probable addiction module antidote protein
MAKIKNLAKKIAEAPKWEDTKKELYKDDEFALLRLKSEVKEFNKTGDMTYLMMALGDIIKYSNISITDICRKSKLSRQTIYNAISNNNIPKVDTFATIMTSLGYKMSLKPMKFA